MSPFVDLRHLACVTGCAGDIVVSVASLCQCWLTGYDIYSDGGLGSVTSTFMKSSGLPHGFQAKFRYKRLE